ncbi:Abi-alpha family protein [Ideonella sp. DXS22W]|uniref:Abi-alpha family protein n=1 Tax=Pseudaquabacterium inlustre TaxID=2984192 RepID=A0ABU9CJK9_9BURK
MLLPKWRDTLIHIWTKLMANSQEDGGVDIAGFGKIAKAIPPKVYERTADALVQAFTQLTAPITATTAGLGKYLAQKFDNMVEAEKAIATFTVEKAVNRAMVRLHREGRQLLPPPATKPLVRSIEEASRETDPLLHEMWANLIASQLTSEDAHPHFVELLSHFSSSEARILLDVHPLEDVGENNGGYISMGDFDFEAWVPKSGAEPRPWTISCALLYDLRLVAGLVPSGSEEARTTILYRTRLGTAFLKAVTQPPD